MAANYGQIRMAANVQCTIVPIDHEHDVTQPTESAMWKLWAGADVGHGAGCRSR